MREEVQESQGPRVPRSKGPKDQDISNSHLNTSLTLKKVYLVSYFQCSRVKNFVFKKLYWLTLLLRIIGWNISVHCSYLEAPQTLREDLTKIRKLATRIF